MTIRLLLLLILLFTCISLPVHADDLSKVVDYMAAVTGTCTKAIINGLDRTRECNRGFILIAYKTGRVAYIFVIGEKPSVQMITFGGDKGAQLTVAQNKVIVDSLDIYPKRMAASGSCVMEGNPKVSAIYTCEAHSLEPGSPYQAKIVIKSESMPKIFRSPNQ